MKAFYALLLVGCVAAAPREFLTSGNNDWNDEDLVEADSASKGGLNAAAGGLAKLLARLGIGLNSLLQQLGGDKIITRSSEWPVEFEAESGSKGGLNAVTGALGKVLGDLGTSLNSLLQQLGGDKIITRSSDWNDEDLVVADSASKGGLNAVTGALGKVLGDLGTSLNSLLQQLGGDKIITRSSDWNDEDLVVANSASKGGLNAVAGGLTKLLARVSVGVESLLQQLGGDKIIS